MLKSIFKFFFKLTLILFILCFVVGIGVLFFGYRHYAKDLPKLDVLSDYNPAVVSEVYSNNGVKIGEFWRQKRYLLGPEELPKVMIQAFVASEDDRFFDHNGIDLIGITRAAIENYKAGYVVQGGSTITQQVIKSMLLTPEQNYERKIKEAILAIRLERKFSKMEILYLYLNEIYLGNRSYGIQAAAQNYFRKNAKELTIAEAALIAGLAKAPSRFSPFNNFERAMQRQKYVIKRMYEVGYITEDQYNKAINDKIVMYRSFTDKDFNLEHTPWFTEFVRREIQDLYGENVPYTHGLKIETTLDIKTQKAAQEAILWGTKQIDRRQGYRGGVKIVDQDQISIFSKKNHLNILKEIDDKKGLVQFIDIPEDELAAKETPLQKDKIYQGIITKIERGKLLIRVGNAKGIIYPDNYKWALSIEDDSMEDENEEEEERSLLEDKPRVMYDFSVGEVIEVKILEKNIDKEKTYEFSLEQTPKVEGALVAYEPESGHIKALIGGKDFSKTEFNRATQARRQTGSIIKPLIYSAALDKGYHPDIRIDDAPIYVEHQPGEFWSPRNYGGNYRGLVSFESGLVYSRNIISVKILMDIGVEYAGAYIRKLGVQSPLKRYYSMALGSNDMTLMEITRAFGVFPNQGILPKITGIKKITDRFGRIIYNYEPKEYIPYSDQLEQRDEKLGIAPIDENSTVDELAKVINFDMNEISNQGKDNLIKQIQERNEHLYENIPEDIFPKYNLELFKNAEKYIKKDRFRLTEVEKEILYGHYIPDGYVISPRSANNMNRMLRKVVSQGTGKVLKKLNRPAAGKTGTTNDETDVWFIGYVPQLIGGIWFGFDEYKKLGDKETGGKTAAPAFTRFMETALDKVEVKDFDALEKLDHPLLNPPKDPTARLGDTEGVIINNQEDTPNYLLYD
jgi:penicillin-binding protein 1A